jgi:hypothetical protein
MLLRLIALLRELAGGSREPFALHRRRGIEVSQQEHATFDLPLFMNRSESGQNRVRRVGN